MRPPKPQPLVCPICKNANEYEWDGEDWAPDCEWWSTADYPFLDSRSCWLKAEGYVYDRQGGRWVRNVS